MATTRVALALGSGGARGYAHIGAIEVLVERGFDIVGITGSSMGSLVGGMYASGHLDDYTAWCRELRQLDVLRLVDLSFTAPGAIKGEKVFAVVRELIGDRLIEDLPLPFTAVATDLFGRKEVWFQRGSLELAIRASVAMPTVLTPVFLDGKVLVDGGVMNPVPMAPTAAIASDAVIAVSLHGDPRGATSTPDRTVAANEDESEWGERMRSLATRLLDREVVRAISARRQKDRDEDYGLGKLEVMNHSFETMQAQLAQHRLASYPPDVLVTVPKDACRSLDFHRAGELIEIGRNLTEKALETSGLSPTR